MKNSLLLTLVLFVTTAWANSQSHTYTETPNPPRDMQTFASPSPEITEKRPPMLDPVRNAKVRYAIGKVKILDKPDGSNEWEFQQVCSGRSDLPVYDARNESGWSIKYGSFGNCSSDIEGKTIKLDLNGFVMLATTNLFPTDTPSPLKRARINLNAWYADGSEAVGLKLTGVTATRDINEKSMITELSVNTPWDCKQDGSGNNICKPLIREFFTATFEIED